MDKQISYVTLIGVHLTMDLVHPKYIAKALSHDIRIRAILSKLISQVA